MTRIGMMSSLLIVGLAATHAAVLANQEREPAQTRSTATTNSAASERQPTTPAVPEKTVEKLSVLVTDTQGHRVPDVEVKVVDFNGEQADSGPTYRTGADGRVQVAVDGPVHRRMTVLARAGDRAIGWASCTSEEAWPKATDDKPMILTLLPRSHQVEGSVVDTRGTPIRDVRVRAFQFNHDANGFATDLGYGNEDPSLARAVTDLAGRYRLSLPQDTTVMLAAYHPRFVGPIFACHPQDQTILPVTLEDAGGIAGTVLDSATGLPMAGAKVSAEHIEHTARILGFNSGRAVSDAQGHFAAVGLVPGVYNLRFRSSPHAKQFTARAVEGVRVKAGDEARADLRVIAGRRFHGMAIEAGSGKPLAGVRIMCYNASHPRSGAACQGTNTDEHGRFEYFVPPGPALVYINSSDVRAAQNVAEDRDPDPIVLKQGGDSDAKPPPGPSPACEVRVRVRSDAGDRPVQKADRSLTGRVFDQNGSPLVAVQVEHDDTTFNEVATDRLGIFRFKGLPHGPLQLSLRRNGEQHAPAQIPADAVEIDVIFPQ